MKVHFGRALVKLWTLLWHACMAPVVVDAILSDEAQDFDVLGITDLDLAAIFFGESVLAMRRHHLHPDVAWIYLPCGRHGLVFPLCVLAWEVSITIEKGFCLSALDRALIFSNPEIFNTDQGSQFTSTDFTGRLERNGIAISMDDRDRVFDNIFIERLWRTVKYEEVYLHDYQNVREAKEGLSQYFSFYNKERFHSSLGNHTPEEVYVQRRTAF